FFIKKYRADTNAQVTLLVDTSGSMRYAGREGGVTKFQYAQFLAAALGHLASRQQDAVGLTAFGARVHTHVPALNRTGHMRTVYGRLSALEAGGETRLAEALHLTADRLTRRGVVVLVSDFYESPEQLAGAFQHLRFRGHDLIAFHVLDPKEVEFEFEDNLLLLEDAETLEQLPVLPDVVAGGYRERVSAHVEALRQTCAANRVDYELVTTDRPLDFALFSFLSRRAGKG
ncbi:MAG TPA: VWA domain-containing protein, partial [Pyrinomonadaceae bacterium]